MNASDVIVSSSMASLLPMTAPPHEPSVFENVTVMMSAPVEHAVLLGRAPALLAEHAEAVGFVVEEERVGRLPRRGRTISGSGAVSPRIEYTPSTITPLAGARRELGEDRREVVDVVVAEPLQPGAREPDRGDERVVGLIVDDRVVVAVEVARDPAEVGDVAGGEDERGLAAVEVGELLFERRGGAAGCR